MATATFVHNTKCNPPHLILRSSVVFLFLSLFFCSFFTSCNDSKSTLFPDAYFGGEIINPSSKFLTIRKNNVLIDTVFLNSVNRFDYIFTDVEKGMYLLEHGTETQNFYLSPGDSLLMRVNTYDFDESLHFSGIGDEKNNFLSEMFLADKKNNELILYYYKYKPSVFAHKTDSIKTARLKNLEGIDARHNFSDEFSALAKKTIHYENYDLRERYTYLVNKYYPEFYQLIPADFHDYRQEVNFNDKTLQTSPGYIRFIENFLINKSISHCRNKKPENRDCYNLYDHENIMSRIRFTDSLIKLPLLKNHFLSKLGATGIIMARERSAISEVLDLLSDVGYDNNDFQDLEQLGVIQLAFLPGIEIDQVPLINSLGEQVSFKKIISKPTVIFIWSVYAAAKHKRDHKKIIQLRKKYPEVNFIGINVDIGETKAWETALNQNGYNKDFEYQLTETQIKKELFQNYINKILLLDASGEVVIGDAYLNSPEIEGKILELLNQ